MRLFLLLAAIFLTCTACGGSNSADLNPPDAPVIPPGRSAENPGTPGGAPMPTVPAS